jgi:DNA invertase Pin-like site-specific DNA recombinase
MKPAFAYIRTSSLANVGADKDSAARQHLAIEAYARSAGYKIVAEFSDEGVSGVDRIETRPGMTAALEQIASNGIRTIIVETPSRFARDLLTQEAGWRFLHDMGVTIIAADAPDAFLSDDPMAVAMRQVLGVFAQLEKSNLVIKLRGARQRKRRQTGRKVEGRKSLAETRPEVIALAKSLAPGRKLREVAEALTAAGHLTSKGTAFSPAAVQRMLATPRAIRSLPSGLR